MGELPLAEIEFRLALLPPISRSAHLAGPKLHAERLIALWKADGEIALAEAFRLLDVETVAGVILRTVRRRLRRGRPAPLAFSAIRRLAAVAAGNRVARNSRR
jgi:hypothetical protein